MEEVLHMPQHLKGVEIASNILNPFERSVYNNDKLLDQKILSHYYVNPAVYNEVNTAFDQPNYTHISSLLADYFYKTNQEKVLAFVSSDRVHLLLANKDGLRFYNAYSFSTPEDFLYWIMIVMETHHLDPKLVPVILGGRIGKEGPITDLLTNYLGDFSFVELSNWVVPEGIDSHIYMDLYLAQVCG